MNLYQSILEILNNNFEVTSDNNQSILREEKEDNYPDSFLKMKGRKVLFQYDVDGVEIYPFFSHGFAKKCTDYVLFYPHNKKLFIFIIELKSNAYKAAYKQFFATKNFVEYILGMARSHRISNNLNINGDEPVELRCLLLSTSRRAASKPLTNPKSEMKYYDHKYGFKYTILTPGENIYVDMLCQ